MLLQSDKFGIFMNVTSFKIHTGGQVDATRLELNAKHFEIAQSGLIDLSNKVNCEINCFLLLHFLNI